MKHFSWEKIMVASATLLTWAFLSYFLYFLQIKNQVGDTAFVAQVLHNFKHTNRMQTTYYTTTTESIDHVWYKPAAEVCVMDLESKFPDTPWGHHYYIAYLLIPFARLMSIPLLVAILHAGIYTSVLLFAYLLARLKKMNILLAGLFALLVSQHPLWDQGLTGQLYFNRFFLPFSGLLILLLEKTKTNYLWIFLASALAASTNEIYGITIFIIFLCYMWIYKRFERKPATLGIFFLLFGLVSTAYIQRNFPLGSTQTNTLGHVFGHGLDGMIRFLWMNIVETKTQVFLIVNFIAMGGFILFNLRLLPPLLLLLGPNIFLSVGGAEKVGWSTHYHTGYFVPLIWVSLLGLSRFHKRPWLQGGLMLLSFVLMIWANPANLMPNEQPNIVAKKLIHSTIYQYRQRDFSLDFRRRLREAVGDDATISLPEAISYNLHDHVIYYYPMGIDSVSTVILRYDDNRVGDQRFYSINYGQQDPNLDVCIRERMRKNGFDFTNPTIVDGWAIIKK